MGVCRAALTFDQNGIENDLISYSAGHRSDSDSIFAGHHQRHVAVYGGDIILEYHHIIKYRVRKR